jgi:hypothetical protein
MGHRPDLSDDEVVRLVAMHRAANGSCSYSDLASSMDMTKTGVRWRIARLVEKGRLEVTPRQPGSIRVAAPVYPDDAVVIECRLVVDLASRQVVGVDPAG